MWTSRYSPPDLDLPPPPGSRRLHIVAHVDVDMPFPWGRHHVEHDIFARKALDPHFGPTPETKRAKVMGYGYRLYSWSDAISPGADSWLGVRLTGKRIVRGSGDDETVLILRRHGADGCTGGADKGQKKKEECRESAEQRHGLDDAMGVGS